MNSRGDRNCVLAGRSAVISCSNTAPDTSSTTRAQTDDFAAALGVRGDGDYRRDRHDPAALAHLNRPLK